MTRRAPRVLAAGLGLAAGLHGLLAAGDVPARPPGLAVEVSLHRSGPLAVDPSGVLLDSPGLQVGAPWPSARTRVRNSTGSAVDVVLRVPGVRPPDEGRVDVLVRAGTDELYRGPVSGLGRGTAAVALRAGEAVDLVVSLVPQAGRAPGGSLRLPLEAEVRTGGAPRAA